MQHQTSPGKIDKTAAIGRKLHAYMRTKKLNSTLRSGKYCTKAGQALGLYENAKSFDFWQIKEYNPYSLR